MFVDDWREASKQRKARLEPRLGFVHVDIQAIMEGVRREHFPHLPQRLQFFFVRRGSLACVCFDDNVATVYAHEVLNHSETPEEVFSTVCKHELLHLVVPKREVKGRVTSHPPEFWEREDQIAPERDMAWRWLLMHLGNCLKRRPQLERIDVMASWRLAHRLQMMRKACPPSLEAVGW